MSERSRYYLKVLFIGGFGVITAVTLAAGSREDALTGLALLLGAGFRVLPSISRLVASLTGIRAGCASLGVVLDDLDDLGIERLRCRAVGGPLGPISTGGVTVCFDGVRFAYPGHSPALRDVTVAVAPGASLGVSGPIARMIVGSVPSRELPGARGRAWESPVAGRLGYRCPRWSDPAETLIF